MHTALWILLGVAALAAIGYLLTMRDLFRKSKEAEKNIDPKKIKKWEDEED